MTTEFRIWYQKSVLHLIRMWYNIASCSSDLRRILEPPLLQNGGFL
jgi:hypothetical protein